MRRLILSLLCLLWLSAPMLALAQTAPATPQTAPAATPAAPAATPAAPAAPAAPSAPTLPTLPKVNVGQVGDNTVSLPLQTLLLMTAITLIPSALLAMTAFTRIIIVLGLLRQALGTGQTPSNQVLVGLALFLTMLVMMPVGEKAWAQGMAPYLNGQESA